MYSQSRFDGFVVALDALADGAREQEQHDERSGRNHICADGFRVLFCGYLRVFYAARCRTAVVRTFPGQRRATIGIRQTAGGGGGDDAPCQSTRTPPIDTAGSGNAGRTGVGRAAGTRPAPAGRRARSQRLTNNTRGPSERTRAFFSK